MPVGGFPSTRNEQRIYMDRFRKPAPPRGGGRGGGRGGLTPDQWSQQQAEKLIAAQVAAIQAQQKAYLDELARQAQARAEQGRQLASWLQGRNFPGQVQGLFQNAGHDVAGYAQGFSGQMRDIASQGAAEQLNMLSGTGQEGAIRNEGEGMGNVMYGQYGYIPAKGLAEQGAAFAADAAMQPAFSVRMADEAAMKLQQDGMGELSKFAAAIAEARGQKPMLAMDLADKRRAMNLDAQDRALAEQDRQRDWFLKMAAYYNAIGDDKRANEYLKLAQQHENRYSMKDQGYDVNGNLLPGWKMGPNGPVKVTKGSDSKRKTYADGQKAILQVSDNIDREISNSAREVVNESTLRKETVYPSYEELYKRLWTRYSAVLSPYKGTTRKRLARYLETIIRQALQAAGVTKSAAGQPASPNLAPGTHSGDR